jgi:hypothetical protein
MNAAPLIERLSVNVQIISGLVDGVSKEQGRWKPSPERWSILEVVNHLYDEEREDFRTRLGLFLHDPEKEWPGIDPEGWVTTREYQNRDLGSSLTNFITEREGSLTWLRGLGAVSWGSLRILGCARLPSHSTALPASLGVR